MVRPPREQGVTISRLDRTPPCLYAAYESDAFAVEFEASEESGDRTITVERAAERYPFTGSF
ncbi:hypothetical protein ACERIT_02295 [Halopenitus sp. H-Gu1]|uniref:hypothetical protein n=1 Tax=Halopenitus sp. H-Gu1 TaxID=3242697 RepID=UPI00359D2A91